VPQHATLRWHLPPGLCGGLGRWPSEARPSGEFHWHVGWLRPLSGRGTSIRHTTPADSYRASTSPPSSRARLRVISRDPNPVRVGSTTGGPPFSSHRSRRIRPWPVRLTNHAIVTSPVSLDQAPYFPALVRSSCRHNEIGSVVLGGIRGDAPSETFPAWRLLRTISINGLRRNVRTR
jgi:hypothetical protein